jgi:glycosyltransferase involved in cell wall biosynthesis
MKIIISTFGDISENAGTIVRAKRIFEILKKKYDVTLIARPDGKKKLNDIAIIKVVKIKLWGIKQLSLFIRKKIDCVYCSNDWFVFPTYWIFSKICGYKLLFEAHDILSGGLYVKHGSKIKLRSYKSLEKFIIKHADHIITVSESIYDFYKRYNKKIDLIPLFTDENVFKRKEEVINYPTKKSPKLAGLIGPFDTLHNKPPLEFLYENIDKFNRGINFVIIGKCDNRVENERITYTNYLDSVQDYINQLSHLDAVLVYKSVAPGPYTKILESMSCSLPVFTMPKGVVGLEHVKHGRDIFIFENDDNLIDGVNKLIFDNELMKEIGRNARITVEKYYSKKANEKKLVGILENLLSENNASK